MRFPLAILGISLSTACATVPDDRTLSYGCGDTVVLGTVADNVFGPAGSTGNLLGNGWISGTLHVREVIKGENLPAIVPVSYFAHSALQRDDELMLVLKHTARGYEIQTGQFTREQPVLASRCV